MPWIALPRQAIFLWSQLFVIIMAGKPGDKKGGDKKGGDKKGGDKKGGAKK